MSLARLLASSTLQSAYVGLILAAGRRIAEGLFDLALRLPPLRFLRMVQQHRAYIEQRAHRLLRTVALAVWAAVTLDSLGLLRPMIATGRTIWAAELTRGALQISVGDVLSFVVTVWAAFFVSSLVRFVLQEDVFPRLSLGAGLPYALSSLVSYAIVTVGFIVALLVLGVNLDRVTVLGGAFGVGVGFGLQNVVNNFVSGLYTNGQNGYNPFNGAAYYLDLNDPVSGTPYTSWSQLASGNASTYPLNATTFLSSEWATQTQGGYAVIAKAAGNAVLTSLLASLSTRTMRIRRSSARSWPSGRAPIGPTRSGSPICATAAGSMAR